MPTMCPIQPAATSLLRRDSAKNHKHHTQAGSTGHWPREAPCCPCPRCAPSSLQATCLPRRAVLRAEAHTPRANRPCRTSARGESTLLPMPTMCPIQPAATCLPRRSAAHLLSQTLPALKTPAAQDRCLTLIWCMASAKAEAGNTANALKQDAQHDNIHLAEAADRACRRQADALQH